MNNLIEFLTSKEIIIVYIIAGMACLLCFIIYLVEKNTVKRRQRQNTRELNKLVEEIQDEVPSTNKPVIYEEPILQAVEDAKVSSVTEMIDNTKEINVKKNIQQVENVQIPTPTPKRDEVIVEPLMVEDIPPVQTNTPKEEEVVIAPIVENVENIQPIEVEEVQPIEEELEYTTIEPDPATAKLELKKITEELKRQEEEEANNIIELNNYEEQQEENAIISLQELVTKSKDLYAQNELSQYADEGNEPISLEELEQKGMNNDFYEEPFIIENVVDDNTQEQVEETVVPITNVEETTNVNKTPQIDKKFHSSPIISPIYGIEGNELNEANLELENTANYDKLDAEIKKTNEFLMTLKELQKKLD